MTPVLAAVRCYKQSCVHRYDLNTHGMRLAGGPRQCGADMTANGTAAASGADPEAAGGWGAPPPPSRRLAAPLCG